MRRWSRPLSTAPMASPRCWPSSRRELGASLAASTAGVPRRGGPYAARSRS
jgi:hypothetical protein